jgi:hypothetical protein
MSENWVEDIGNMHYKFGVNQWFHDNKDNKELMQKYMNFRMLMIQEELHETMSAVNSGNSEEVVDGLIDMCVFAIGTLNVMGIDSEKAWNAVHDANMIKSPGVKAERPNPFGLPDLIKPEGWVSPSHEGNHGNIPDII